MTMTDDTTIVDRSTQEVDGHERDRMSHYAKREDILAAAVEGTPITALCGKKWVPSRDPDNYPVCKTCQEILDKLFPEGEEA